MQQDYVAQIVLQSLFQEQESLQIIQLLVVTTLGRRVTFTYAIYMVTYK